MYLLHPGADVREAEVARNLEGSDENGGEDDGGPPWGTRPDVDVLEEPLHA